MHKEEELIQFIRNSKDVNALKKLHELAIDSLVKANTIVDETNEKLASLDREEKIPFKLCLANVNKDNELSCSLIDRETLEKLEKL